MNSETGNNIVTAVKVIRKSYENINKMMMACQDYADGRQVDGRQVNYRMLTDVKRFLRYRSDRDVYGWMYSSFILLYQHKSEEHNNVIYGMDINLEPGWGKDKYALLFENQKDETANSQLKDEMKNDVAAVCLAKYVYDEPFPMDEISEKLSPSDHWKFYHPLYDLDNEMESTVNGNIMHRIVRNGTNLPKYFNLRSVTYSAIPLISITATNLTEKIFGTFDRL